MNREIAIVAGIALGIGAIVLLVTAAPTADTDVGYCDSEFRGEDAAYVVNMNICMATPGCTFSVDAVLSYRKAVSRLQICNDLQTMRLPESLPPHGVLN